MAPQNRSAGSEVFGSADFQRWSTKITATNERALTANVAAGPDAAINIPPIAGPTALAILNATLLSETAAESSGFGTSSGTIASHAGPFSAAPRPRKKVSSKSAVGF